MDLFVGICHNFLSPANTPGKAFFYEMIYASRYSAEIRR